MEVTLLLGCFASKFRTILNNFFLRYIAICSVQRSVYLAYKMKSEPQITQGVSVSVCTEFRHDLSRVKQSIYFFNYKITIENRNDFAIQLLSRHWYIFDSLSDLRIVKGDGVIGEQPTLQPGEVYSYTSGCDLNSEIGNMNGYYLFRREIDNDTFHVTVPKFDLIYSARLN